MSTQSQPNPIPEWTVADRLRKVRESAGYSQSELADLTGISRRTISNYEQGSPWKRTAVMAWAMATGYPYSWIVTGVDDGTNPPGDQEQGPTGRSSVSPGQGNARVLQLVA